MQIELGIAGLFSDLNERAPEIRRTFDELFAADSDTVPIPFFGDIANAKVITVGLNPSDGELRGRGWPRPVNAATLCERLPRYFSLKATPPHSWFVPWIEGLETIGASYSEGTAAHVDLCPWPTKPMRGLSNKDLFESLVRQSLPWFWRCMQLAPSVRLVLLAGAVTKKDYIHEFLIKAGEIDGASLIGKIPRGGSAFVGYPKIRMAGKTYPAFFCSVSPSSPNRALLPLRIRENQESLRAFLL